MVQEKIHWKSDSLEIAGELYIPEKGAEPFPTLIICHGIPGKTKDPGDPGYPRLAERFCREGFLVLIFNFRGTGSSGGNFDILGWAEDLERGLEYLAGRRETDKNRLFLMGFSAGAAVSIYVAGRRKDIAALVSCAAPAEFQDLISDRGLTDFLTHAREVGIIKDPGYPPSIPEWKKSFRTVKPLAWIRKIPPRPLLLLHGTADEVVAERHAYRLYERAEGKAELCLLAGAGHRLRVEEEAMKKAMAWLIRIAFGPEGRFRKRSCETIDKA